MKKKKIEVDISGRVDQKSYNSVITMLSEDKNLENSIFLSSKLKSTFFAYTQKSSRLLPGLPAYKGKLREILNAKQIEILLTWFRLRVPPALWYNFQTLFKREDLE